MKQSAVFICGDRSPYGIAHLEAIAENFDLKALVLADDARWRTFRSALSGGREYVFEGRRRRLSSWFKHSLGWPLRWLRNQRHWRRLRAAGAPIHVLNDVNAPETVDLLKALEPQILISAAYPQIFKRPLLELAPLGAVNFHPSLLPRCRGAHPHYWSLATGEKTGGVSAHFMTERIDDGDIIAQRSFDLGDMYYPELYARIVAETPALVSEVARFMADPDAKPAPQDESAVTLFRNDRDIHRRLDFATMNARQLHDRIRAGGAYALFRGRRTQIFRAAIRDQNRHQTNGVAIPPGVIADLDESGVWVATGDDMFLVVSELSSRNRAQGYRTWATSTNAKIGERFE